IPRIVIPRTNFSLRAVALVTAWLAGGSVGCAPKVLLEQPADWPTTWKHRQLFHTPHAYLYARNQSVAREVDDLMQRTAAQYASDAAPPAKKGLIIVVDKGD